MNNNRSFIKRNLELQCRGIEREDQEKSEKTKRGSKIINLRVSLSAAQMNPDTDFSMNENLIDICFLAVTAYLRLPRAK